MKAKKTIINLEVKNKRSTSHIEGDKLELRNMLTGAMINSEFFADIVISAVHLFALEMAIEDSQNRKLLKKSTKDSSKKN